MTAAKIVLAALVIFFAGKQIYGDLAQPRREALVLSPGWLALSALLYVAGMTLIVEFWRRTLIDMGGKLSVAEGQRAGLTSELGKYVPGKAVGIVLRCTMASGPQTPAAVVVVSTFYQTLAMMAVGSLVSLVALLISGEASRSILLLAAGLAGGFTFLVLPPVFTRLVHVVALPFRKKGDEIARPVRFSTLLKGLLMMGPAWVMMGLSVAATGPGVGQAIPGMRELLVSVGSAGLSIAAGFVMIFVPAGLGAREYVLKQTIVPVVGASNAAMIAVASRIVQVLAELLVAGILYFAVRPGSADKSGQAGQ